MKNCFGYEHEKFKECDTCNMWMECRNAMGKHSKKEPTVSPTDRPVVKKSMVVCAAHRLMNHPGACRFLHGHNYIITVYLGHRDFDRQKGMVMDFGSIKSELGSTINRMFDHKTILQESDPLYPVLLTALGPDGVTAFPYPPTAENMALFLVERLQAHIDQLEGWRGVYVCLVEVEETPNNMASAGVFK